MSTDRDPLARPTRDFFEQNPRSILLRNICIGALDASEVALASEGQDQDALAELLDANRQLHDLGIDPNIHRIDRDDPEKAAKQQQMANDPVLAMEWIAGQVRNALVETGGFSYSGSPEAVVEHDELDGAGGNACLVDLQVVGPKTRQFMSDLALIGIVRDLIDYHAGPSFIE